MKLKVWIKLTRYYVVKKVRIQVMTSVSIS
jgi:hypothetical protein